MRKASIPHDALVMVGDGARAVFLRNTGSIQSPSLTVENVFEQHNPPTHDQGTDRPTRGPTTFSKARGNIEEANWHQLNEGRFASEIADELYRLAHAHRFDRLIIIAPPKVLGALRQSLHKEVLDRIEAEVPKELAWSSVNTIRRELASWW